MPPSSLKVPGRPLADWLREVCLDRRTGRLDISSGQTTQNLFFIGGDLYLAPEHPVFRTVETWLREMSTVEGSGTAEEGEDSAGGTEALSFRKIADQILDLAGSPEVMEVSFVQGAGQIRIDLAGPLPTSQLVMESAVRGRDETALLRQLGGEKCMLQATSSGGALGPGLELDPQEAFLLSRLDHPTAVGELLTQLDLGRQETLERICRLRAMALVAATDKAEPAVSERDPNRVLIDRLAGRIAQSLEDEPIVIDVDQHRELLRNLFSRFGGMTHFELLAVSLHSSDEEVHKAFIELGRMLHPNNAARLGLTGKEGVLAVLFERATEAYLTLSDPDRKVRYSQEIGPVGDVAPSALTEAQRHQEQQALARKQYETALGLAERLEYHSAIQLLEQAAKADPQPEYYALLGDCQAENPQWLDRAAFNYKRAVELQPGDPSLQVKLGHVYERRGDVRRAQEAYAAALEVAPQMEQAQAGLMRVTPSRREGARSSLGERLRSFLRGDRSGN